MNIIILKGAHALYKLIVLKFMLAVPGHNHHIMIKIHQVFLFKSPYMFSPVSN